MFNTKSRCVKAFCLVTRSLSRKFYMRSHLAIRLYYWSDYHLFHSFGRLYVIPGFIYRALVVGLNTIISFNTIDFNHVRSRLVGGAADKLMHRMPDEFRYPQLSKFATPAIGQEGRGHKTQNA